MPATKDRSFSTACPFPLRTNAAVPHFNGASQRWLRSASILTTVGGVCEDATRIRGRVTHYRFAESLMTPCGRFEPLTPNNR